MDAVLALDQMTVEEKLRAMEALKATFPKSRGGVEAVSGCAEGLRVT
jgi:hypothetical protein